MAFVLFLQNHDQIGNRAFGERLTTLAYSAHSKRRTALQLLRPAGTAYFHGRGNGK